MVVSTATNRVTDRITGSAVMLEKAARPSTTLAPMSPLAASPSRRTSSTLSHTTSSVENTMPAWLVISEKAARLNNDMGKCGIMDRLLPRNPLDPRKTNGI